MKQNDNGKSISDQIRELNGDGKTRSEISKILTEKLGRPIQYQHVNNVLRNDKMRDALKKQEAEEERRARKAS